MYIVNGSVNDLRKGEKIQINNFPCSLNKINTYMDQRFSKIDNKWIVGWDEAYKINKELEMLSIRNPEYFLDFEISNTVFDYDRAIAWRCLQAKILRYFPKLTNETKEGYESLEKYKVLYCNPYNRLKAIKILNDYYNNN